MCYSDGNLNNGTIHQFDLTIIIIVCLIHNLDRSILCFTKKLLLITFKGTNINEVLLSIRTVVPIIFYNFNNYQVAPAKTRQVYTCFKDCARPGFEMGHGMGHWQGMVQMVIVVSMVSIAIVATMVFMIVVGNLDKTVIRGIIEIMVIF